MEKLILRYDWGSEPYGGTDYVPFEYESKDKFVFDVLEKFKKHKWEFYGNGRSDFDTSKVIIFPDCYDVQLGKYALENIEHNVLTLDEWFNQRKQNPF